LIFRKRKPPSTQMKNQPTRLGTVMKCISVFLKRLYLKRMS
jgi:hypothetical protein